MKPLYMWAGGKSKMIPKYLANPGIPYTGYDTFVEPFFGGGAMMIHIAQMAPSVKRFVMNDINSEIVGLYRAIKSDCANFIAHLDIHCNHYLKLDRAQRKAYFYKVRQDYIDPSVYKTWSPTQESATLYFLMKTAFNGIWQTTKASQGRFATPSGLLKETTHVYDLQNIHDWNVFLQRVDIHCGDWQACVNQVQGSAFFFFDPPYRDSFTQYGQTFGDQAHINLIQWCQQADQRGQLVYYCNRQTADDFYEQHRGSLSMATYDIKYTAGRRKSNSDGTKSAKQAQEILLYSPRMSIQAATTGVAGHELFEFA